MPNSVARIDPTQSATEDDLGRADRAGIGTSGDGRGKRPPRGQGGASGPVSLTSATPVAVTRGGPAASGMILPQKYNKA